MSAHTKSVERTISKILKDQRNVMWKDERQNLYLKNTFLRNWEI